MKSYCNNPNYLDGPNLANNVDPDQTPQNAASDQGLHWVYTGSTPGLIRVYTGSDQSTLFATHQAVLDIQNVAKQT